MNIKRTNRSARAEGSQYERMAAQKAKDFFCEARAGKPNSPISTKQNYPRGRPAAHKVKIFAKRKTEPTDQWPVGSLSKPYQLYFLLTNSLTFSISW
jgi:hypothetical protein